MRQMYSDVMICDECGAVMKPRVLGETITASNEYYGLTDKEIDRRHEMMSRSMRRDVIWVCPNGCVLAK